MKHFFLASMLLGVVSCGGGGGGEDGTTVTGNPSSSLLNDNPAPANARFQQYQNHLFELQPDELNMAGNTLFLKVYLDSGSVLFLGQIDKNSTFSLPVSVPTREKVLKYDLFSDFAGEERVSGEVAL
ncbi:hypothetical protein C942_04554 [Photobacterium marinum]|uniref:Lipoprotein n=1 Tax=Photobacterium marinum TaxID=1056511 RepID=L8JDG3_9GAMM|nr:hypothetical protein [Photobacterium marinum]ELR66855.1 hypothetical protein C942_04554 [Photobacterium marinum]